MNDKELQKKTGRQVTGVLLRLFSIEKLKIGIL